MSTKKGQIKFYKEYTIDLARKEPKRIFIFGDNLARRGKKGQAIIRSEPNSLGVPTKRYPCMKSKKCFFSDTIEETLAVKHALDEIDRLIKAGKKIALPKDGIGTGLAELKKRSPVIYKYITLFFKRLDSRYMS